MRTYRVDRMKNVKVTQEPRTGAAAYNAIDIELSLIHSWCGRKAPQSLQLQLALGQNAFGWQVAYSL